MDKLRASVSCTVWLTLCVIIPSTICVSEVPDYTDASLEDDTGELLDPVDPPSKEDPLEPIVSKAMESSSSTKSKTKCSRNCEVYHKGCNCCKKTTRCRS